MENKDFYNETSNTVAGINTPANHEDEAPTDLVEEAVAMMMDEIEEDFTGEADARDRKGNRSK